MNSPCYPRTLPVATAPRRQQGAVLIVSLVILVVVSLLGVANMQSSTAELKMATSQRDRDVAFAAAEAALASAEQWLEINKPPREKLYNTCGPAGDCFNSTCSNGFCFDGTFATDPKEELLCQVGSGTSSTQRVMFWRDSSLNVWEDAGKHREVEISGLNTRVKFIIEFLCFIPPDDSVVFDDTNPTAGEPLYRITALADGNGDRARVMLQSTYMVVEQL